MTGLWQETFKIPRTDPRFLDSTEDDHLRDMIGVMYRTAEERRHTNKLAAATENLKEVRVAHDRLREAIETGVLGKRIQAFEQKQRTDPVRTVRIVRIKAGKFRG